MRGLFADKMLQIHRTTPEHLNSLGIGRAQPKRSNHKHRDNDTHGACLDRALNSSAARRLKKPPLLALQPLFVFCK